MGDSGDDRKLPMPPPPPPAPRVSAAQGERAECEALQSRLAAFETYLAELAEHEQEEAQKPRGGGRSGGSDNALGSATAVRAAWTGPLHGHGLGEMGDGGSGGAGSAGGVMSDTMLAQVTAHTSSSPPARVSRHAVPCALTLL